MLAMWMGCATIHLFRNSCFPIAQTALKLDYKQTIRSFQSNSTFKCTDELFHPCCEMLELGAFSIESQRKPVSSGWDVKAVSWSSVVTEHHLVLAKFTNQAFWSMGQLKNVFGKVFVRICKNNNKYRCNCHNDWSLFHGASLCVTTEIRKDCRLF